MSYAAVAAHNAPPAVEQPHADPGLLNVEVPEITRPADDSAKVNVVASDFKQHPTTVTSEAKIVVDHADDEDDDDDFPSSSSGPSKRAVNKKKANKALKEAEAEGAYIWGAAKQYLFRPGVAGGLIGLVNVGLITAVGRAFYTQPHLRHDTKVISSTVAGALALMTAEGYASEQYRQTPSGQAEERRAREEGSVLYKHLHQQILRPGVAGGLVGLVNTAVLGTVGYFSYLHWDAPRWDRRTVSAVTVGILTLWTGEGFLAERVRQERK